MARNIVYILMPVIISIEGNIGSGKSTFIQRIKDNIKGRSIIVVPEPVHEWEHIRSEDGKTMLTHFYEDQERNAFSFQMMAYISRLANIQKAIRENPECKMVITERCLETDRNVFAKMLFEDGKIRDIDYQIYSRWFDTFADSVKPSHYVYLKADAEVCLTRVNIRSREGEGGIPLGYLKECGDSHTKWLETVDNVITCDANLSKEDGHPMWETIIDDMYTQSINITEQHKEINYIV